MLELFFLYFFFGGLEAPQTVALNLEKEWGQLDWLTDLLATDNVLKRRLTLKWLNKESLNERDILLCEKSV